MSKVISLHNDLETLAERTVDRAVRDLGAEAAIVMFKSNQGVVVIHNEEGNPVIKLGLLTIAEGAILAEAMENQGLLEN